MLLEGLKPAAGLWCCVETGPGGLFLHRWAAGYAQHAGQAGHCTLLSASVGM